MSLRQTFTVFITLLFIGFLAFLNSGCSKAEFTPQTFTNSSATPSPGKVLPAKVDIVLVPDNSGSISSSLTTIQNQMSDFIAQLAQSGWDYHIMISQMDNPTPITKALVDTSHNSGVVPAGNLFSDVSDLMAGFDSLDVAAGSKDYTYSNTYYNLLSLVNGPNASTLNLIRPDALLAIVVITNGAEYSVDPWLSGSVNQGTLQAWASAFAGLKGSSDISSPPALLRFYPVAADSWYAEGTCEGGSARNGASYTDMLSYINGKSANFCDSTALSTVLSDIGSDLQSARETYIYSYIVLDSQPVPSSIQITKSDGSTIPHSATNGWTYLGGPQTVDTVTAYIDPKTGDKVPFQAFAETGYVIQLNGSAQLVGSDTVNVTYSKP